MSSGNDTPVGYGGNDDGDLRDAALRRALAHAPDREDLPDARTRDAIRKMAHNLATAPSMKPAAAANNASAAPWWRRLFGGGGDARTRMPWNAAFATVLVAGFVAVLWHREPIPDARLDGEAHVGGAPAAAPAAPPPSVAEIAPSQAPATRNVAPPAPAAAGPSATGEERSAASAAPAREATQEALGRGTADAVRRQSPAAAPAASQKESARASAPPPQLDVQPAPPPAAPAPAELPALAAAPVAPPASVAPAVTPRASVAPAPPPAAAPAPVTPAPGPAEQAKRAPEARDAEAEQTDRSDRRRAYAAGAPAPAPAAPPTVLAEPAPSSSAVAAAPAPIAPAPAQARRELADSASASAGPGAASSADVGGGLRRAPLAAAAKSAGGKAAGPSFSALDRWTFFDHARAGGTATHHARGDVEGLAALVNTVARSATQPDAPLAAPVEARLSFQQNGASIAVLEIAGDQVRWVTQPGGTASIGTPPAQALAALRAMLLR